jgi:chromosome partitioning protein
MTKIISLANQKGGCGKTTITMQLAGSLGIAGHKVLVVDADPQGTATRWAANAEDTKPFPATIAGLSAAGSKVHREIKKYVGQYGFILIDCPPAVDSATPQSALLVSDLVIVPVIPSPADLWAAVGIQKLIEQTKDINESLQARLVANMCQPNTNLNKEALDVLDDFGIPRLQNTLYLRTAYRQSAVFGGTVYDLKDAEKAIFEVTRLRDEVLTILSN